MAYETSLYPSFVDPRISFSNDFADTQHQATQHDQIKYKEAPVSSDFEFSVKNYGMIPADEIFFQGVLLPLKDDDFCCKYERKVTTLREELSVEDDDGFDGSFQRNHMNKSSRRWKERLGLKSKKEQKKNGFAHDQEGCDGNKTQNCLARILECED